MNADDLRDVTERLEALEALAKLFGNSWLEHTKSQIQDEKIRAYLTVFDDAFPGMDHVVEFVRQNAQPLAAGEDVQENFAGLAQALLQRESEVENDVEIVEETSAPEGQDDTSVDDEQENATKPTSDEEESKNEDQIDALFG